MFEKGIYPIFARLAFVTVKLRPCFRSFIETRMEPTPEMSPVSLSVLSGSYIT
jgi:hypothetical protein